VLSDVVIPFALAGGTLIFTGVIVVFFFAVVFGYYTRRGSGISQTPYRRPDAPPEAPSELAHDVTSNVRDWERGTEGHHAIRRSAETAELPDAVAEALAEWRRTRNPAVLSPAIDSTDHVRGSTQGLATALYLDPSSEPCRAAYRLLSRFADAQQIRLAVRQLPLADVHRLSLPAAEVLEAAAAQDAFFELLDDLASTAARDRDELIERAARRVPDPARLRAEVDAGRYQEAVVGQIRQAASSGAQSVPAIYIEGSRYDGPITRDELDRRFRQLGQSG
jgi:protein-disulfide isomerase